MNITFTAKPMPKPVDLPLKAELAWNYLEINSGGWVAAETGDGCILVCNEACDLGDAMAIPDYKELINWLIDTANDALSDDPDSFLEHSGAVHPSLLTEQVISAVLKAVSEE